jgi:hypothetical protein
VLTNIHPATSQEDALTQLDSHIPLLHSERKLIVESLYDLAFRDGAKQGRQAGVEHVQNRLREIAGATPHAPVRDLLTEIADSFDSPHAEYRDPGQVLREKLTAKSRARNGT